MKIIFASIIYTFFLICSSALAFETEWYICDSCTTAQKATKAKSNAPNDPLSYAYVVDVNNGTITKWTVTIEPGFISAISIAVDSTASTKFNDYLDVVDVAANSYDLSPTEASCGFDSSLQLVGNAGRLSDLYDWFLGTFDPFDWDTSYFGDINYTLKTRISNAFEEVSFTFEDSSELVVNTVDWNWNNLDLRFEYEYAEDENSAVLPEDPVYYEPVLPVNWRLGDYLDITGYIAVDSGQGLLINFMVNNYYHVNTCSGTIWTCVVSKSS